MALTIAVLVGGFALVYSKIDPWTRDFVTAATLTPTAPPTKTPKSSKSNSAAANTGSSNPTSQAAAETPTTAPAPAAPAPTETPTGFNPDYRVSASVRVNLRSGPSRDSDVVTTLDSGTELQYLNEAQAAANPAEDGNRWLKFRTESGDEGWVREIDVEKTG